MGEAHNSVFSVVAKIYKLMLLTVVKFFYNDLCVHLFVANAAWGAARAQMGGMRYPCMI